MYIYTVILKIITLLNKSYQKLAKQNKYCAIDEKTYQLRNVEFFFIILFRYFKISLFSRVNRSVVEC